MVRIHVGQPFNHIPAPQGRQRFLNSAPPIIKPDAPRTVPATSLAARILNVFAMPGSVFEEVRCSPPAFANWFVPSLIGGLALAFSMIALLGKTDIIEKNLELQKKQIEQQVQEGRISRENADSAVKTMQRMFEEGTFKVFGLFAGMVGGFVRVVWWGFVLWLLARLFLRVRAGFGKMLEASGLAGMIGVLAIVVASLLQSSLGNPLTAAGAAQGFDFANPLHLGMVALNVFHVWQAFVLATALSRMAGVPFLRAAMVMFPFWLLWMAATGIIGAGLFQLAG
jgi:hypothetical protein